MATADQHTQALVEWARAVEKFSRQVSSLADTIAREIKRQDDEIAELRDEVNALSNRITSVHNAALRALTDRIGGNPK